MDKHSRSWVANTILSTFGFFVIVFGFFMLVHFLERAGVEKDEKMIATWKKNLAEFNEIAQNCNWERSGTTYEYISVSQRCLSLAKKFNFSPVRGYNSKTLVFSNNMFKGYKYTEENLLPLHADLDAVPEHTIPPYSDVYRKLDQRWYLYKTNPSD